MFQKSFKALLICERNRFTASLLLVFLLAAFVLFSRIDLEKAKVHADEPGWVASGYIHTELLINLISKRKFDLAPWQQKDSYFAMNGQIGKWLLGFPISIYFRAVHDQRALSYNDLTVPSFSALTHLLWDDLHAGKKSAQVPILLSRSVSAFFGILCSLLVFLIGYSCSGILVGIVSVVLLLSNHLFVISATRAMTDVYYLFFLLCACLSSARFIKEGKEGPILSMRLSILWGVFSALAASVKVTGVLVGGFYFCVYALFEKLFMKPSKFFAPVIAFACSALIVIYLMNPAFWIPVSSLKPGEIAQESKTLARALVERFKGDKTAIQVDQYPQLENLFRFSQVFLEWNHVMKEQQENISKGIWKLNQQEFGMTIEDQILKGGIKRVEKINKMFFYLFSPFPFVGILFLISGLAVCIWETVKKISEDRSIPPCAALFFFFVANYVFILGTLKLNWDRYFLTTVVSAQMIAGLGLVAVGKNLLTKLLRTRS